MIDEGLQMSFNHQDIFNLIVAVGAFLGVFVFNQVMTRLTKLEDELGALRTLMPEKYVHKDDYRADMAEIKAILKRIYERLDDKADKA